MLCDAACMARVDSLPETVTPSGLKFRDIAVGKGPTPPTGYQARLMQPLRAARRLGTQCPGAGVLARLVTKCSFMLQQDWRNGVQPVCILCALV